MWPAALITAGAAAFGRLFVTGILPSAVIVTVLWLALSANAFSPDTSGLRFGDIIPPDFGPNQGGAILLFLLGIVVLTALLEGFHLGIVRLLEGYWGASRFAVALSAPGLNRHKSRFRRAVAEWNRLKTAVREKPQNATGMVRLKDQLAAHRKAHRDRLRMQRVRQILDQYPPEPADVLPTRLGNALRSGELRAGERYGWNTIYTWPRLYLTLPEPVAIAYRYSRDAIDAAAIFCLTLLVVFSLTTAAFFDDPALLWIPLMFLVFSYVAYQSAVASALTLNVVLQAAYDLNRFSLFESMRQPMPNTPLEEHKAAVELSKFLRVGFDPKTAIRMLPEPYSHAVPEPAWRRWFRGRKHSVTLYHDRPEGSAGPKS